MPKTTAWGGNHQTQIKEVIGFDVANVIRICGNLSERNGRRRIRRVHLQIIGLEIFPGEEFIPGNQGNYQDFIDHLIEFIEFHKLPAGDFFISVSDTINPDIVLKIIREAHPQILTKYAVEIN